MTHDELQETAICALEGYEREVWCHAGCLGIAEGCVDWDKPTKSDSPAMVAVRKLRKKFLSEKRTREALQNRIVRMVKNGDIKPVDDSVLHPCGRCTCFGEGDCEWCKVASEGVGQAP